MNMTRFIISALTVSLASPVFANVDIAFIESAPKDRFVVTNASQCAIENAMLTIDLTNSEGALIFDTTSSGAGVEVFQPFEVRSGDVRLANKAKVNDGDTSLSVTIGLLPANESVSFTIDVDDTKPEGQWGSIRVAGSEMQNATVSINGVASDAFGQNSTAQLRFNPCI